MWPRAQLRACASAICAVFLLCGFANFTFAKEIILTPDMTARFLASFAEMRVIAVSEGLTAAPDVKSAPNRFLAVLKAIKSTKLQTEAGGVAARHGFANIAEWTGTGRAIGQAYIYVTAGPSRGLAKATVDKHKDAAQKEIGRLAFLSAKQKQKLKDNLDDVSDGLSREPPPENVIVVQGMKESIEAAFKAGAP